MLAKGHNLVGWSAPLQIKHIYLATGVSLPIVPVYWVLANLSNHLLRRAGLVVGGLMYTLKTVNLFCLLACFSRTVMFDTLMELSMRAWAPSKGILSGRLSWWLWIKVLASSLVDRVSTTSRLTSALLILSGGRDRPLREKAKWEGVGLSGYCYNRL
jgi:hypothetical protein